MTDTVVAPDPNARLPRQIPYIIGNEACERFSFYAPGTWSALVRGLPPVPDTDVVTARAC
jgi:hypothetical protein